MRVEIGRHGPRHDYRGAQVALRVGERVLIGDVRDCYYQEHGSAGFRFKVRHFNGEPWPFDPSVLAVEVLERSYCSPDDASWDLSGPGSGVGRG